SLITVISDKECWFRSQEEKCFAEVGVSVLEKAFLTRMPKKTFCEQLLSVHGSALHGTKHDALVNLMTLLGSFCLQRIHDSNELLIESQLLGGHDFHVKYARWFCDRLTEFLQEKGIFVLRSSRSEA
ncbi:hypothetical protein Tcan_16991, partial [Toxocara canis]